MRHPASRCLAPLTIALVLALTVSCDRAATPPAASTVAAAATISPAANAPKPNAAWQAQVDTFIAGYFQRNPTDAAGAGKHEFDGKLPDWSAAGLKENLGWLHAQRDGFAAFTDDKLDATQRFQREYVLAVIDKELFWLEDSGFPQHNPAFYTEGVSRACT